MEALYKALVEDIENEDEDDKLIGYISKYRREFVLCPGFIKTKSDLPELTWQSFKFNEDNAEKDLPEQQGVYAFSICIEDKNLPVNSYILYVGKAGDNNSKNTIKKRYRDYIRELKRKTRPKIHRMLKLWDGHLSYHYAEVPNGVSTGDIEKQLTTIFIPPYNTNDFDVDVKDLLKGASIL